MRWVTPARKVRARGNARGNVRAQRATTNQMVLPPSNNNGYAIGVVLGFFHIIPTVDGGPPFPPPAPLKGGYDNMVEISRFVHQMVQTPSNKNGYVIGVVICFLHIIPTVGGGPPCPPQRP
jgi:hypothetical protein